MTVHRLPLFLAGVLVVMSAPSLMAADLGGACCSDLEDRVAELEATTARKGTRKVSLTISGWVAEQVMWWDDGVESNTYVGGIGTTLGTNVKLTGQATIVPGWTAGYLIHLEADGSDMLSGTNQNTPSGPGLLAGKANYVQTLQSYWFVKSEALGKVSVGLQSQASDNAAILVDGSGSLVPANYVSFDYGGYFARLKNGVLTPTTIAGVAGCSDCNGVPQNSVRYDTPTFGGFSASASWGADDLWDMSLRYAGDAGAFKLAATIAYSESTSNGVQGVIDGAIEHTEYVQTGVYIQHVGTGLFAYGAYQNISFELNQALQATQYSMDHDVWYAKGGIRRKWSPLGHTVLYGEYESFNDGIVPRVPIGSTAESEVSLWGIGVVQEIDSAAMSLWLSYRHIEMDASIMRMADGIKTLDFDIEDFEYLKAGALINF